MSNMAPKKKHEYFGRGRGSIECLSLYKSSSSEDSSRLKSSSPIYCATSPSSSSKYNNSSEDPSCLKSRPAVYGSSSPSSSSKCSLNYDTPSPFDYSTSPMHTPLTYSSPPLYHPSPFQDLPKGLGIGGACQYPSDMSENSLSYSSSSFAPYVPSDMHRECRGLGDGAESMTGEDMPPTYTLDDDGEGEPPHKDDSSNFQIGKQSQQKNKRAQRCRMCANHNEKVDMKGHKWYCKYRNCNCKDCHITRKTQYYMKERQKLTRHQQQQQHEEQNPGARRDMPESSRQSSSFDQLRMDFPREEEMVNETMYILDPDLLEKVNQICRPKSSNMHH